METKIVRIHLLFSLISNILSQIFQVFVFLFAQRDTFLVDNRASSPIIAIPKAKLISYREYGGAKAAHHRDVGFFLEEGRKSIVSIHLVAHPLPLSSIIHCTRAGASVSR